MPDRAHRRQTGDAAIGAQARRWVDWMNYVRNNYVLSFPAFAYIGPQQGLQPDPGCSTAPGFISLCRSNAIVNADCNNDQSAVRCSVFNYGLSNNHIIWNRSSIREMSFDAADTWTVVCGALGRAIGLQPSGDTNSCMSSTVQLGTGVEKYYVTNDWLDLISTYNHPAGS